MLKDDGYIQIDHRFSPGVSADDIRKMGLDPAQVPHAAGGTMFEDGTLSCSHCQKQVAKSMTRTRERGHCKKCNHYICDDCNANLFLTGECALMRKKIEVAQEMAFLFEQKTGTPINGTQLLTSLQR